MRNEYGSFLEIAPRSEEHTSELQSHVNLVCRLLLEPTPTSFSSLSLHDALPIFCISYRGRLGKPGFPRSAHSGIPAGEPLRPSVLATAGRYWSPIAVLPSHHA